MLTRAPYMARKWVFVLLIGAGVLAGLSALVLQTRYSHMSTAGDANHVLNKIDALATKRFEPYEGNESVDIELVNVRELLLGSLPGLEGAEPLDQALEVNRLLHESIPLSKGRGVDFEDFDHTMWSAITGRQGHLCQGLSFIYMTALKSLGIESRFVGMYQDAQDAPSPVTSHASVDVLVDGQWIALDPTYNMSIRDATGQMIGWATARQRYLAGRPVFFTDEGGMSGRTFIENYGSPEAFVGVFSFMALGPSVSVDAEILPADWDGVIHYEQGRVFDAANFGRIYAKLAAPLY